ncbi:hypothetical protein [Malaciobacter canalis]|uniref:hypothetical protein n=1 Tax=Malaciobacter canalis TaxID=1912871 RepID=UPI00384D7CA8
MKKNEKVKLIREIEKPIKIFGKQLKITRVVLILAAFLIYFVALYYETKSNTPLVLGIIPLVLLSFTLILIKNRILYIGKHNIECSNAGDLYITKLKGFCPKCQGELKVVKKLNDQFVICKNNKEHKFYLQEN